MTLKYLFVLSLLLQSPCSHSLGSYSVWKGPNKFAKIDQRYLNIPDSRFQILKKKCSKIIDFDIIRSGLNLEDLLQKLVNFTRKAPEPRILNNNVIQARISPVKCLFYLRINCRAYQQIDHPLFNINQ